MNGQFGMGMPMNMMGGMGMPMNMMGGMGMPMNNMMGNGMPMNFMMMGGNDEDWMQGFKMGVEEVNNVTEDNDNDEKLPGPKINIIFRTTKGTQTTIVLNHGKTVEDALTKYLKRVSRPDLINKIENKICFLYNAAPLKFGDKTPIEEFFKNNFYPKVVVNDVNNLIGA